MRKMLFIGLISMFLVGCQSIPLFQKTYREEKVVVAGLSRALLLTRLSMLKDSGADLSSNTEAVISIVRASTAGITYRFGVIPLDDGFFILYAVDGTVPDLVGADYASHYSAELQRQKMALVDFLKTGQFSVR